MLEIPLNSEPEQLFSIPLSGESFDIRITLNSRSSTWYISISQGDLTYVDGVALLGGVDIFKQYNIPIENAYVINIENSTIDADKTNLGTVAKLFILTDEEVSSE